MPNGRLQGARSRMRARRRAPNGALRLFQIDGGSRFLELGLELVGLFLVDALLDGLRSLVDECLGLLQAEARGGADDLDDLDLLVAGGLEDDVERRLLLDLGATTVTAGGRARGRGGGDCGRGYAEGLLEGLDSLGELEHGDRLELVDPFLSRGHGSSLCLFGLLGLAGGVRFSGFGFS